jgi:hypothetical protein
VGLDVAERRARAHRSGDLHGQLPGGRGQTRIVHQSERRQRARTGDAVGQQSLARLEADDRGLGAATELAVERAGREAEFVEPALQPPDRCARGAQPQ